MKNINLKVKYMDKILIAEDEKVTRLMLCDILRKDGFHVVEAENGREAVEFFKKEAPSAVILDIEMPVMGGIEAIRLLKAVDSTIPIIIATAHGDISTAVETMQLGAYDFLVKPVEAGKLIVIVRRAIEKLKLERELRRLHVSEEASIERALGKGPSTKKVVEQIKQVGDSDFSVIIQGETGTGKTLLARILHNISKRANKEFVRIDLGAVPETLVESEFFGYEKGAFTGAVAGKKGFFEIAEGGTAFFDDLENISPFVQSKLLTIMDSKVIHRLGGRKPISSDVRIIAASSMDLQKRVTEGKFREDLFFRLGEFIITLPPLRERKDDIPFLAKRFLEDAAMELNKPITGIKPEYMDYLMQYSWPGNIRELKNVIRRAALLCDSGEISREHIVFLVGKEEDSRLLPNKSMPLKDAVGDVEKRLIRKTLEETNGNKAKAAAILQIDIKTLRSKMTEYGIE